MATILLIWVMVAGMALLTRSLLTLLHEVGHALPALWFTRTPVILYLGSYSRPDRAWQIKLGRLEVYLRRHPLWLKGMCRHSTQGLSTAQQVGIVLGGVLVSLLATMLLFYAALHFDLHGALKLLLFFLLIFSVADFVGNLVPWQSGDFCSDGLLLKLLLSKQAPAVAFSPDLQTLIAQSRLVALDLGADCITTQHLLLADCTLPYAYSLRHLLFTAPNADAQLAAFHESGRVGPARTEGGSVPLSASFEDALPLAQSIGRQYGLRPGKLLPCHLLLAAASLPGSELSQVLQAEPPATLTENLLAYYRNFPELQAP